MTTISTEIIINASREKVWQVLMDFPNYGAWNPFIISISGEARLGGRLTNVLQTKEKQRTFKPKIVTLDENRHFEWVGSLPLGLFVGRHSFRLEEVNAQQVKLVHGEHFSGLLSGMIMKKIGEETRESFIAMNRALKERVETMGD